MTNRHLAFSLAILLLVGCGTTRTTDTARTATEQLLISDAVDRALEPLRFDALAGRKVYLDGQYLDALADKGFVVSAVREKLVLDGALLRDQKEDADIVVELRVGALGTDRYEWLVGLPQTNWLMAVSPQVPVPPLTPEIPLVKKINQKGVAKIHAFAYDRRSGELVATSGQQFSATDKQSVWVLGLGPLERGSIRKRVLDGGTPLPLPEIPRLARQPSEKKASPESPAR